LELPQRSIKEKPVVKLDRQTCLFLLRVICASTLGSHAAAAQTTTLPSGWTDRDIGAPTVGGGAESAAGTFKVRGAGLAIGGAYDQFHFAYRAAYGDLDIRVRLDDLDAVNSGATAGIMIRDAVTPTAKSAYVLLSAEQRFAFEWRDTDGVNALLNSGALQAAPAWMRLVRQGDVFRAYSSATGDAWTLIGSATISMSTSAYVGLAVTGHDANQAATGTFSSVAVAAAPAAALPAPWTARDIGSPVLSGRASTTPGGFTVTGSGPNICCTSDQFQFVYQPITGDTQIVALVASLQGSQPWSKAGLMMRSALTGASAHTSVFAVGANGSTGSVMRSRLSAGGLSYDGALSAAETPRWLRLVREGSVFSAYLSRNGSDWSLVGTENMAMPATVYVGLAVTSRNASALATAQFSNVAISNPMGKNQPPTVSISSPKTGATFTAPANISITATAGDVDGSVTRGAFYAGTRLLGSDTTSPFSVTWHNVPAGTYSLKAVATDNEGATTTSAPITVTVAAAPPPPIPGGSSPNWSGFLNSSRAINWSGAGFTIPAYSTNCAVQPRVTPNSSSAAAANAMAIQNALSSCDETHNVVTIPAGTYYVTNWTYGSQGHQVVRGAGPKSTYLYMTSGESACTGDGGAICMLGDPGYFNGNDAVLPRGGSNQCRWTGGYSKGTTSITLSDCGDTPPVNQTLILDQANDVNDTGGVFICDNSSAADCTYEGHGTANRLGRVIDSVTHSQQQVVYVTAVTPLGGGSYSVGIKPGVYFTNIRSSQSPGAWWPGFVQHDGLEDLTVDYSHSTGGANTAAAVTMMNCYQCWVKNVRSINAGRNHIFLIQSAQDVIRDSYFYQSQSHSSVSYSVESIESSGFLVENNIFQQVTNPLMFGQGAGAVIGYNFSIDDIYTGSTSFAAGSYASHSAANNMNLWEGNNFLGIWVDDAWGSSAQTTYYRNMLIGWQNGKTNATVPIMIRSWSRAYNAVGNVLGQPGYHSVYQVYATSASQGVGSGNESTPIYALGWAETGAACGSPPCDALTFSTMMRWGNWDVVHGTTQWNPAEASPAAVSFVNANFTPAYFSTLSHALPASLYYSSTPSWWPSRKAWPPIGPDVADGNIGMCSGGEHGGAQATSASQCTGGTLSTAWGSHVTSIPAQDCYLTTMGGPPDGSGPVLTFDARQCYP
jgi:regulation of enolase protein 1 (concanavalin A-like superfamily)